MITNLNSGSGTFVKTAVAGPHGIGMYNVDGAQSPALLVLGNYINLVTFQSFIAEAEGVVLFAKLGLAVSTKLVADHVQRLVDDGLAIGVGAVSAVEIPSAIDGATFTAPAPKAIGITLEGLNIAEDMELTIQDFANLLKQIGYSKVAISGGSTAYIS